MRNRSENQIILVLIRHGETKANREHRYLGRTDEALSKDGIEKLISYKKQNYYPDVKYVFTSPMKRCLETVKIIYPDLSPVVIPEWEEMDFGHFEYKNYEELKNNDLYQAWIDSGGVLTFPEGESRENFILRCKNGFANMCGKLSWITENETKETISVGMIVHGGTIMALLSEYGKKDYFDCQVLNGRGYKCRIKGWGSCVQIKEVTEI